MSDFDSPWKEALDVYFGALLALFAAAGPRGYRLGAWIRADGQRVPADCARIGGRPAICRQAGESLAKRRPRAMAPHSRGGANRRGGKIRTENVREYNYRLFDRYNREAVSLAVLGDDNPQWRPDHFGYSRWGFETRIRFPVIKLLDYADRQAELEQNDNPFATIVLAHLAAIQTKNKEIERYGRKARLIKSLYRRGMDIETKSGILCQASSIG